MKIKPEYCKVHDALSILVGKWKPIILLYLMSEGTIFYNRVWNDIEADFRFNARMEYGT